uniref:F-box domain-containing protein n=1 Tax=Oryza barthii TaxID=65489 RepID=A0A0D3GLT6_9ORYZ
MSNHCVGGGAAGVDDLTDDLVAEILLRLRPSEPACLVRASAVCKPWRRLLTDQAFLRRYRDFHGAPPLLGFLHNVAGTTTTASSPPTTSDYLNLTLTPNCDVDRKPAALVGDALHFALAEGSGIIKYNMGECSLSRIHPPVVYKGGIVVMAMGGNLLGLGGIEGSILSMWSSDVSLDGGVRWEKNRVIKLESLLPSIDCVEAVACELAQPAPIGFVDGADIVFVRTDAGIFMIELKSMCVRKVCKRGYFKAVFPYTSFCTPGVHLQQNRVQFSRKRLLELREGDVATGMQSNGKSHKGGQP